MGKTRVHLKWDAEIGLVRGVYLEHCKGEKNLAGLNLSWTHFRKENRRPGMIVRWTLSWLAPAFLTSTLIGLTKKDLLFDLNFQWFKERS